MNEEKLKEMAKPNKVGRAREFLQQGRKDEVYGDNEYYRKGFLDGGLYADEHPMYIYTDNEQVIANLQEEVERLKNPWRDAKKELPDTGQRIVAYGHYGESTDGWYGLGNYKVAGATFEGMDYWMPMPPLPEGGEK